MVHLSQVNIDKISHVMMEDPVPQIAYRTREDYSKRNIDRQSRFVKRAVKPGNDCYRSKRKNDEEVVITLSDSKNNALIFTTDNS